MRRLIRRDERGVAMVLYALLMLTILVITALVIDLSFVRNTRQSSKSVADATTAAAMQSMAKTNAKFYPWEGVCAGLAYLKANDPGATYAVEYFDGTGVTEVSGSSCTTLLTAQCTPNDPTSWAWIRATDGDKVVDIRAGYLLPDPLYADESAGYSGDVGSSALGSCDQLATIVADVDDVFFGGVAGAQQYATAVRTVGRAVVESNSKIPPAFLMLERKHCDVLSQQVGSGLGIAVESASAAEPGRIHIDSSGRGSCTGSAAGAFTVYSDTLGSSPKFAGIRIYGTETNQGQLSIRALDPSVGTPANAASKPDGICTTYLESSGACLYNAPIPGEVIGRSVVDEKYNKQPATGASFLENLHATDVTDARRTSVPVAPPTEAPWHEVTTCNNHDTSVPDATATRVFVNCPSGYNANLADFAAATEIVFNGPVDLGNGDELLLPSATRVVVGGTDAGGITTAGGSVLAINTSAVPTDTTYRSACTATDLATTNVSPSRPTTSLTVFGGLSTGQKGAVIISGAAAFCQTSVYLAGPKSTSTGTATAHNRLESTDATYDPTCATTPCPLETALTDAGFRLTSNGKLRWSAPNRITAQPPPESVGHEDLALWMESGAGSDIAGELDGNGLFFVPNGHVRMQSPSEFTPRDAQFIARSLKLLQGALLMKPTAGNSVLVDSLGSIGFVR
jgi:hypothetical protein